MHCMSEKFSRSNIIAFSANANVSIMHLRMLSLYVSIDIDFKDRLLDGPDISVSDHFIFPNLPTVWKFYQNQNQNFKFFIILTIKRSVCLKWIPHHLSKSNIIFETETVSMFFYNLHINCLHIKLRTELSY